MQHIKVVVCGDGTVGKTCLLIAYTMKAFPKEYVPTVFDNFSAVVDWDGHFVSIGLWDTAGQDDFEKMRPLSYDAADAFLLLFSIGSATSLQNVVHKWMPEVSQFRRGPDVPILLVGTKSDVRSDEAIARDLQAQGETIVSYKEGRKVAEDIGAWAYIECSAIKAEGFSDVFGQTVACVLNRQRFNKKPGTLCWDTSCQAKLSKLKKQKCIRCSQLFCPNHCEVLPKGHDYKGKYICLHCKRIDAGEPLKRRTKESILNITKEREATEIAKAKEDLELIRKQDEEERAAIEKLRAEQEAKEAKEAKKTGKKVEKKKGKDDVAEENVEEEDADKKKKRTTVDKRKEKA